MEHIKLLSDKYSNLYDIIFFCDDDDMYDIKRIEIFTSFGIYDKYDCMRESKNRECNDGFTEFWNYAVKPHVLQTFYNRIQNDIFILKHKYADILFRCYLRMAKMNIGVVLCSYPLYKHNTHSDSVCSVLKNNNTPIREAFKNNGMMALLHGSQYFKDIWKVGGNVPIKYLYSSIPNYKTILNIADRVFQRDTWD
jgi:hypothetical protein